MSDPITILHPLEGRYIIYKYGEQDSVDEAWALALFQLKNNKLDEIYHPRDHVFEACSMGRQNLDELVEVMTKHGIKNVVSVYHRDSFFGIPAKWRSLQSVPEGESVDEWYEFKPLGRYDDQDTAFLQNRGVTVDFYDDTKKSFNEK
jgi:hypothetical protein